MSKMLKPFSLLNVIEMTKTRQKRQNREKQVWRDMFLFLIVSEKL